MESRRIGPYRLVAKLGSGAQATVHLAEVVEDVDGLESGERVALKVLHDHMGAVGGALERFGREARVLRAIDHPNVVRMLDAGTVEDGDDCDRYLATELVDGVTLRRLLDEDGPQSEALCRYVGRSIARGPAAIHDIDAVHRDLKPENVILTKDERVKIMDLGVALLRDELRVSKTGEFVGSVLYAAPEQFVTHERLVDGRADLYALGLVLYELLTGAHPYEGDDVAHMMSQHLRAEPPRPSHRTPGVSPFFEAFLLGLLAKSPDDRPASAALAATTLAEGEDSVWWRRHGAGHLARARAYRPLMPREHLLCGRDADLAHLRELWARARAGEGGALLLLGEAGIGKTRLIDEFAERVHAEEEPFHYLVGTTLAGGAATGTGAFTSAYREFFGLGELEGALEPLLVDSPALVEPFADFLRGVPRPLGQAGLSRDGLTTAFIRVAQALASRRPTLIVIDDLHFSPQEGRALFAALAQAVAGHPILLVGLARPGLPADWLANLRRLRHVDVRELERLDEEAVESLLGEASVASTSVRALSARLSALTDGNPFFILETLRAQQEGGALRQTSDGSWTLTTRSQELEAPEVVKDIIAARVVGLDPRDRDLLDLAAVCGPVFEPAIVAEVLDQPRLAVLRDLGRLQRTHQLVVAEGDAYRFDHHLVQETLYEVVPELLRREYHAAVGTVLRTRLEESADRPEVEGWTVEACRHLLRGDRGGQALRILDRALAYLERRHQLEAAVGLLGDVLDVPGLVEGARRAELLWRRIPHLATIGWIEERTADVDALLALATELDDRRILVDALAQQADLLVNTGSWEDALAVAEQGRAHAESLEDPARLAKTLNSCGTAHLQAGRMIEARTCYEEAISIARAVGARHNEAQARCNVARPLAALGDLEAAYAAYREAIPIFAELGEVRAEAVASGNYGTQLQFAGRYEEAEPLLRRCLELSRKTGYRFGEANALGNLGNWHYAQGRLALAHDHLARSEALLAELANEPQRLRASELLGLVQARLGRFNRARMWFEDARAGWERLGMPSATLLAVCALAEVAADRGDYAEAERLLGEALASDAFVDQAETDALASVLGVVLLRQGKREAAAEQFGRVVEADAETSACLAFLDRKFVAEAETVLAATGDEEECHHRISARYWLWRAGATGEHLRRAHELLEYVLAHAPPEDRAELVHRVPLYQDVSTAWQDESGQAPAGDAGACHREE